MDYFIYRTINFINKKNNIKSYFIEIKKLSYQEYNNLKRIIFFLLEYL